MINSLEYKDNYSEEENYTYKSIDRFESEIDVLIEEIMRRAKNQAALEKEIQLNQRKLDEIQSKSTYNIKNIVQQDSNSNTKNSTHSKKQQNVTFENESKKIIVNNKPFKQTLDKHSMESLSPIAENDLEGLYEKYDSKINLDQNLYFSLDDEGSQSESSDSDLKIHSNVKTSENKNFSFEDISQLIKTATDTNADHIDINFIKNFFQSEISNCIKTSENDKDLQVSLNKMLQDFLVCLETNLTEIKKHSINSSSNNNNSNNNNNNNSNNSNNTNNNGNSNNNNNNNNKKTHPNHHSSKISNEPKHPKLNEEKYWNPDLEEKEVETVFQNIYRSHALTHVFWDDQEEELEEQEKNNQLIKVYSTWSENLHTEKKAAQPKQLKCEFIPMPNLKSTHRTSAVLLDNTNNNNISDVKKSTSFLKKKSKTHETKTSSNTLRTATSYNSSKINFPLQGGHNNKSQSKFSRSVSTRLNTSDYKSVSSYKPISNQYPNMNQKSSQSASVTNISEILHEISNGKSTCSFASPSMMMIPSMSHSNRNNSTNSNVIKKFIHKIKTIV